MADDEKEPTSLAGMALDLAKRQGVSAVLVIGLVYWLTMGISAKLERHIEESAMLQRGMLELIALQRQNVASNQRTCLLLSKTDEDRIACVLSAPK